MSRTARPALGRRGGACCGAARRRCSATLPQVARGLGEHRAHPRRQCAQGGVRAPAAFAGRPRHAARAAQRLRDAVAGAASELLRAAGSRPRARA